MVIRIMIADDHAVFRSGLRALLEKEPDFRVVQETGDGAATIRELETVDVDVLLLDISMPGMAGSRVARTVRERWKRIKIIVLTMHEDEYYVDEFNKIGVHGYMLKKSSGKELVTAIKKVYAGGAYVDPAIRLDRHEEFGAATHKGEAQNGVSLLTTREREVCKLLAYGYTNVEVSEKLCISDRTVETHRSNIMSKLGLKSRVELVRFAIDNDLLKVD